MEQELTRETEQEILEKIRQLKPVQVTEVVDFIDFLTQRSPKESAFVQFLCDTAGPRVGLEEVRRRLAKIPGQMSAAIRELRDERG